MNLNAAVVAIQVALGACTYPAQRVDEFASAHGFSRAVVRGKEFEHVVYANGMLDPNAPLHVYLEGDGSTYLDRNMPAADPTPRLPIMLRLMALDASPAIYLGRPCYFGLAKRSPCSPEDWTQGRFSLHVVESMAQALISIVGETDARRLELFGHSGGGTLAVLLARRVKGVTRVITLAGNLDHGAWTQLHDYAPLEDSLNPVDEGRLPNGIEQLHLAGEDDRNVPATLVEQAAARLGTGEVRVLPGVGHACCWEDFWPAALAEQ